MIKIALKHWIVEKCINVLFDGVSKNFLKAKNDRLPTGGVWALIPGDKIYKIVVKHRYRITEYFECELMNLCVDNAGYFKTKGHKHTWSHNGVVSFGKSGYWYIYPSEVIEVSND